MRLWGRVASGMMLFIAAVFALIAVFVPEARRESLAAAALLIAVAWFGVPALVRLFTSFAGDAELLTNGVAGSATIESAQPTGWRYNRTDPIVRFDLRVEARGAAYPLRITQAVDPELLQRLAPGVVVTVRVHREDHKNVVIDWRDPIRVARDALSRPGPPEC